VTKYLHKLVFGCITWARRGANSPRVGRGVASKSSYTRCHREGWWDLASPPRTGGLGRAVSPQPCPQ